MLITKTNISESQLQWAFKMACKIKKPTFGDCVGISHGWAMLNIENKDLRNIMRLALQVREGGPLKFVNVSRNVDLSKMSEVNNERQA